MAPARGHIGPPHIQHPTLAFNSLDMFKQLDTFDSIPLTKDVRISSAGDTRISSAGDTRISQVAT